MISKQLQKHLDKRNLTILADLKRMTVSKVALKHGITPQRVYQILDDAGVAVRQGSSNTGQQRGLNGQGKARTNRKPPA